MTIIKGHMNAALKVVVYGTEGIGKTTFASKFPRPIFIDTEGGTVRYDVERFEQPESWKDIIDMVNYIITEDTPYKTLVIDTADKAEALCIKHICKQNDKNSIEAWGYGKGYTVLGEEFQNLLPLLDKVVEKGINVVITAHACTRKIEQPDEMGAYDHWELKLGKKTAPLLKEWADLLIFANYKTNVITTETGTKKATGGRRMMYTTHSPVWDAKNRFGLSDELPFEFESIAQIVPGADGYIEHISNAEAQKVSNLEALKAKIDAFNGDDEEPPKKSARIEGGNAKARAAERKKKEKPTESAYTPDDDLPFELRSLMEKDNISAEQIEKVVASRGKMPADVKLKDYPANIINNFVIKYWANIVAAAI